MFCLPFAMFTGSDSKSQPLFAGSAAVGLPGVAVSCRSATPVAQGKTEGGTGVNVNLFCSSC